MNRALQLVFSSTVVIGTVIIGSCALAPSAGFADPLSTGTATSGGAPYQGAPSHGAPPSPRAGAGASSAEERRSQPSTAAANPSTARRSPKAGWGDFQVVEEKGEYPFWAKMLLWVPNRLLDAVDMFRVDAGVGPAAGAVVRVTKWAQFGYREPMPASLRIGDLGRDWPVTVERSIESGIGPNFRASKERSICPGELGAGVDLLVVGVHAGVCVDEVFDFLAGVVFLDPKEDDID